MCVKGYDRWDASTPVSGPKRIDIGRNRKKRMTGVELYMVAVSTFKGQLFANLAGDRPTDEELAQGKPFPPGYVHLPRGINDEWIKQLVSEQLVLVKMKSGRVRREWRKIRDRNEGLDCFIYARAAMWEADVYGELFWEQVEAGRQEVVPVRSPAPEALPQRENWIPRTPSRWV